MLLDRNRRARFTASLEDYIAQLYEYQEYFDDEANRTRCKNQLEIDVQKSPAMSISWAVTAGSTSAPFTDIFAEEQELSSSLHMTMFSQLCNASTQVALDPWRTLAGRHSSR
jgi:hypothetical protein